MRGYAIAALIALPVFLVAGVIVNLWFTDPWEAAAAVTVVGTAVALGTERFWNPRPRDRSRPR